MANIGGPKTQARRSLPYALVLYDGFEEKLSFGLSAGSRLAYLITLGRFYISWHYQSLLLYSVPFLLGDGHDIRHGSGGFTVVQEGDGA